MNVALLFRLGLRQSHSNHGCDKDYTDGATKKETEGLQNVEDNYVSIHALKVGICVIVKFSIHCDKNYEEVCCYQPYK